ncbi:hypothetical protein Esti_003170 [Eimeria stiedai]
MGLARRPRRKKLHWVEVKVDDGALRQSRVESGSSRGFPSSSYSSTSVADAGELQRIIYHEQRRGDALQATVEQGHLLPREFEPLAEKLRAELLEASERASSSDTLLQQNQLLSQQIEALSKENLSLVKHNRKVQSLEVDADEAKTVIEVLKVQAETNKTMKPFDTPVSTGFGAPPVGSTSSTLTGRTASYYTTCLLAKLESRKLLLRARVDTSGNIVRLRTVGATDQQSQRDHYCQQRSLKGWRESLRTQKECLVNSAKSLDPSTSCRQPRMSCWGLGFTTLKSKLLSSRTALVSYRNIKQHITEIDSDSK